MIPIIRYLCDVQEHDSVVERGVVRPASHILHPRLCSEHQHDPGDNQANPPASREPGQLSGPVTAVTTSPPEVAPWGDTIRNHFLSFQNFVFTTQ